MPSPARRLPKFWIGTNHSSVVSRRSSIFGSLTGETYRGPFALSEPENLAIDRLMRKLDFEANVNSHSAGRLLPTPVSYTTDYAPVDATIFAAMTGVDGDSAVEP